MKLLIFLLLFASQDTEPIPIDHIDVLEVNHVYDLDGTKRFTQLIYWNYFSGGDFRGWKFARKEKVETYIPIGGYLFWNNAHDEDSKIYMRAMRVVSVIETWTYYDPEVENRKVQPIFWRRPLSGK